MFCHSQLPRQLFGIRDMLKVTTTANLKMRAGRIYAIRASGDETSNFTSVAAFFKFFDFNFGFVTEHGFGCEDFCVLKMRKAFTQTSKTFDFKTKNFAIR